jgi:uncharacterized iron-regulated membrane protein
MKSVFRTIHLFLSLASGLFIMIACFTGAILVFEEELQHALHKERYFVKEQKELQLPVALVTAEIKQQLGLKFLVIQRGILNMQSLYLK